MSTHRISRYCLTVLGACLLVAATATPARAQQGLGERIGEQLDRGVDRLSDELREGWQSLRKSVDKLGVRGRVYSRLRWDKQLADSEVDIDVAEEGVVTLRGRVANPEAKQKAVQLAKDTIGVNRVVDDLSVGPAEEPSEPAAETADDELF